MDGMSLTHWQYSRKIRISSRTVLKIQNVVQFSEFQLISCEHFSLCSESLPGTDSNCVWSVQDTYPTTAYFCPLTSRNSVGFLSSGPVGTTNNSWNSHVLTMFSSTMMTIWQQLNISIATDVLMGSQHKKQLQTELKKLCVFNAYGLSYLLSVTYFCPGAGADRGFLGRWYLGFCALVVLFCHQRWSWPDPETQQEPPPASSAHYPGGGCKDTKQQTNIIRTHKHNITAFVENHQTNCNSGSLTAVHQNWKLR